MPSSVIIAIPVFNEARFIGQLLAEISATVAIDHILVIDDGSTDATAAIARGFGVHLIEHAQNMGKGEAMKTAFSFARQRGYRWIIFMDGDGQHLAGHLPAFLDEIGRERADVVLGHRMDRRQMPLHRQLSNDMTSVLISLCAGVRIRDSQCGFRAVRLSSMDGIHITAHGFQVESEMLLKLGRAGARLMHLPIRTVYGDEASSIHLLADTLKFIKLLLKSFWW
ncbi:glycosyltransferase family 2 protein [candidate division KSB1 bacterium]|nr:glycosyltransferase family 2 protein [candidate division KSB1 bacterium]